MEFWHSLAGMVAVRLISADPAFALSAVHNTGIIVYEAAALDPLTLQFSIRRQDFRRLKALAENRGYRLELAARRGIYWTLKGLLKRPVLMIGLAMLLIFGLFVPSRIFFFRVEGNVSVPTRLILEEAAKCGISFGASRREVRSEKMKNALLEAVPQLQWAGVNTSGCVATITVRERQIPDTPERGTGVSSIVASRDGVIWSCTVTRGNGVCKVGQAVKAGQVLVSGYTDCGLSISATRAEGEIYARTEHQITAVTPTDWQQRTHQTEQIKKYALIIGKKRINLYFDSGISDTSCVKMYEENYMTLPGGFQLPVALVTEVWTYYDHAESVASEEAAAAELSEFAQNYLSQQMVAGQILSKEETAEISDGVYCLTGQYACLEMIGQVRDEEIVKPYGTFD